MTYVHYLESTEVKSGMNDLITLILRHAKDLGITTALEIDPQLLIPKSRVRNLCYVNKCGKYGNHYMCPPLVGSLEETGNWLKSFKRCILLQYSKGLSDVRELDGVEATKIEFHIKVLQLENLLHNEGALPIWGMIGGSCSLCQICQAKINRPCLYPDRARPSPESMGIDIITLLDNLGIDNQFYADRITWTGCLLFCDD